LSTRCRRGDRGRSRLHAGLVQFAGQALDFGIFPVQFEFERIGRVAGFSVPGECSDDVFELMIFAEVLQ